MAKIKDRTGEIRTMNNGLRAKVVRYNGTKNIDILFLDVNVVAEKCFYDAFVRGEIKCPTVVNVKDGIAYVSNMNVNPILTFIVDEEDAPIIQNRLWNCSSNGYIVNRGKRQNPITLLHRLIMNATPGMLVDHINMNRLDNRRSNLRMCNKSENMRNRGKQANNVSGFKGVCLDKRRNKYKAEIKNGNTKKFLGYYATAEDAAKAYDEAATKYHGEFARVNDN